MTKISTIRGIMSRCRKAAKLLGQKWELRDGHYLRLKDVEGSSIGEFCPLTASYFAETGERLSSTHFIQASYSLGVKGETPCDIAMAADDDYSYHPKVRKQYRRTLLKLTK